MDEDEAWWQQHGQLLLYYAEYKIPRACMLLMYWSAIAYSQQHDFVDSFTNKLLFQTEVETALQEIRRMAVPGNLIDSANRKHAEYLLERLLQKNTETCSELINELNSTFRNMRTKFYLLNWHIYGPGIMREASQKCAKKILFRKTADCCGTNPECLLEEDPNVIFALIKRIAGARHDRVLAKECYYCAVAEAKTIPKRRCYCTYCSKPLCEKSYTVCPDHFQPKCEFCLCHCCELGLPPTTAPSEPFMRNIPRSIEHLRGSKNERAMRIMQGGETHLNVQLWLFDTGATDSMASKEYVGLSMVETMAKGLEVQTCGDYTYISSSAFGIPKIIGWVYESVLVAELPSGNCRLVGMFLLWMYFCLARIFRRLHVD